MNYNNESFIEEFLNIVKSNNPKRILFVSSKPYDRYGYRKALELNGFECADFNDFQPCPEVSSVEKAVKLFKNDNCDFIIGVGGGSAIDVAKAVKHYGNFDVKILAVPTTAGTGAEVTRFAVLYNKGDKDSVRSYDIIPDYQVFDYTTLSSLPNSQRIVTGLDAFCHSIEAFWSVNANEESREYSKVALKLFNQYFSSYLADDKSSYEPMMKASELAGRAINIAQTAAPHAFSYKIHKLFGLDHGGAVAVCLYAIWKYMEEFGDQRVKDLLMETHSISGYNSDLLKKLLVDLGILKNIVFTQAQFDECISGVNIDRLANHPMKFESDDIKKIYEIIVEVK